MSLTLREIASALGGEIVGGQVNAPGPGHSRKDRSLSVRPSNGAPDGLVVYSHAGDDWKHCRDYVLGRLGISPNIQAPAASSIERMRQRAESAAADKRDAERRTRNALDLWQASADAHGTMVETYIKRRGLPELADAFGDVIRFHPHCPFGVGHRTPAMVCLVRNMDTGEPQALHRTALDADGNSCEIDGAKRLSLGPIAGGAIMLTPRERVKGDLGVGEGLESSASLAHVPSFNGGVWALVSSSNFRHLPILAVVDRLWIATDHDDAGLKASRALADRWRCAGHQVREIIPNTPKADLNDLIRGAAHA